MARTATPPANSVNWATYDKYAAPKADTSIQLFADELLPESHFASIPFGVENDPSLGHFVKLYATGISLPKAQQFDFQALADFGEGTEKTATYFHVTSVVLEKYRHETGLVKTYREVEHFHFVFNGTLKPFTAEDGTLVEGAQVPCARLMANLIDNENNPNRQLNITGMAGTPSTTRPNGRSQPTTVNPNTKAKIFAAMRAAEAGTTQYWIKDTDLTISQIIDDFETSSNKQEAAVVAGAKRTSSKDMLTQPVE